MPTTRTTTTYTNREFSDLVIQTFGLPYTYEVFLQEGWHNSSYEFEVVGPDANDWDRLELLAALAKLYGEAEDALDRVHDIKAEAAWAVRHTETARYLFTFCRGNIDFLWTGLVAMKVIVPGTYIIIVGDV